MVLTYGFEMGRQARNFNDFHFRWSFVCLTMTSKRIEMQNPIVKKYGPYLLNTPIGMFIGVITGIVLSRILSGEFGTEWTRL
jgi:hypothetical protein